MKLRYKHIHFSESDENNWVIFNNKTTALLGYISWFKDWKRFIVQFKAGFIFDSGCLRDIASFLDDLLKEKSGNNETQTRQLDINTR